MEKETIRKMESSRFFSLGEVAKLESLIIDEIMHYFRLVKEKQATCRESHLANDHRTIEILGLDGEVLFYQDIGPGRELSHPEDVKIDTRN
jgi:hypothetical protein